MLPNCRCICRSVIGREYSCNQDGYQSALLWWSLSHYIWHSTRDGGQTKGSWTIVHQSSRPVFQFTPLGLIPVADCTLSSVSCMSNIAWCIYSCSSCMEFWDVIPVPNLKSSIFGSCWHGIYVLIIRSCIVHFITNYANVQYTNLWCEYFIRHNCKYTIYETSYIRLLKSSR